MAEPRIAQLVHYVSYGTPGGEYASQCRAAVVAERLSDDEATLCVLNPSGIFFNTCSRNEMPPPAKICLGEPTSYRGGTWHYAEGCSQ